ncbi:hypothetical protein KJA15_00800 [Patescibacteria group bacterium]|nr:hypothetical protein [Patescibacteria group bacterium]
MHKKPFLRYLLESPENFKDLRRLWWPESRWLELRKAILLESTAKAYKLLTWVRSEECLEEFEPTQLTILCRILEADIQIQKVIVIGQHLWNDTKIWKWVWKWIAFQWAFEDKLQVFIVREGKIPQLPREKRHVDTIIFDGRMVDRLEIPGTSEAISYVWIFAEQLRKAAKDEFERLKEFAVKPEDYINVSSLSA